MVRDVVVLVVVVWVLVVLVLVKLVWVKMVLDVVVLLKMRLSWALECKCLVSDMSGW